jgi:hypothetical protein
VPACWVASLSPWARLAAWPSPSTTSALPVFTVRETSAANCEPPGVQQSNSSLNRDNDQRDCYFWTRGLGRRGHPRSCSSMQRSPKILSLIAAGRLLAHLRLPTTNSPLPDMRTHTFEVGQDIEYAAMWPLIG